MAVTIRVPGTIDLTDQRIQVGDTVAFIEKMNATQQKLEAWTSQDWNNFVADVSAAAQAISSDADAVASAAQQVAANAQQVATDRDQVAANAQQVAANAQQVATDRAQVAANTQQVAANAQQVATDRSLVEVIRQEIVDSADIKNAVEAASGGRLTVRLTDKGQPCVFLKVPAFNCEDVAPGGELGMGLHPAFVKNGSPVPYILVGQHIASYSDAEMLSRAGVSPAVSRTYDQELAAVAATGQNFRQLNNLEWAAVALWCMANGYEPLGNTNYGRHHIKRWETGVRSDSNPPGATFGAAHTLTGSGPDSWHHDGTAAGISDMVGNVWERVSGMKLIDGVFHIAPDGGDYLESDYINTGVAASFDGIFSTRPTTGVRAVSFINGWVSAIYSSAIASDGAVVVVGSDGQYARSTDNGITWSAVGFISGFSGAIYTVRLAADGSLIAGGVNGQYARSTDNGITWSAVGVISGWVLSIFDFSVAQDGSLIAVGSSGQYARSIDNGISFGAVNIIFAWTGSIASSVVAADQAIVVVGSDGYFSRSTDNGQTFSAATSLSGSWSSITRSSSGALVAVDLTGKFSRSTDNGQTFSAASAVTGFSGSIYTVISSTDGIIYAAGASARYARSIDGGVTWSSVSTINGYASNIRSALAIVAGGVLYVGSNGQSAADYSIPLRQSLCIPAAPSLAPVGNFYRSTSGERIPLRGGSWSNAGYAGLGALYLSNARSFAYSNVGLRLAYRDQ